MYRWIESGLWDDEAVSGLPPQGKLLWLYLLTNRHTHSSGLYLLPLEVAGRDTGIRRAAAEKMMERVEQAGLAEYDRVHMLVWVKRYRDYQGRGRKHDIQTARHLLQLMHSPVGRRYLAENQDLAELEPKLGDRVSDRVSHRVSDRVSDGVSDTPLNLVPSSEERLREESGSGSGARAREERVSPGKTRLNTELAWRVYQCWEMYLEARRRFYQERDGSRPGRDPRLTRELEGVIAEAVQRHDGDLLAPEDRDEWLRASAARAAGIGLFLDGFMTGESPRNEDKTLYVEPWRPWRVQKGKADPVPRFAELYWRAKDKQEHAYGKAQASLAADASRGALQSQPPPPLPGGVAPPSGDG